jgi:hypothetical protein
MDNREAFVPQNAIDETHADELRRPLPSRKWSAIRPIQGWVHRPFYPVIRITRQVFGVLRAVPQNSYQ